jgi:hypothetical protein
MAPPPRMSRAARQRLWLLAVAAALLAAAGWQWQSDRRSDPGTLLGIDPATVQRIDLDLPGHPAEHYTRRDGRWQPVDGTATAADEGRLAELADTAAANVLSWRPASDFDPAKIGLAPPSAILTLDGHRLEFGETSVTGPQRYVRSSDRIALVPARYSPRAAQSNTTKAPYGFGDPRPSPC